MEHMPGTAIWQVGMVVEDIAATSRNIADFFGVPMPEIMTTDPQEKSQALYKGQPCHAKAQLAFFQMGQVTLELIQPDEQPSTWREFLDEHGEGVHHLAFEVKGMRQVIEMAHGKGAPLVQKGEYTGGRYAYLDSFSKLGFIMELLEHDAPGK